jgi:hypothetical protein
VKNQSSVRSSQFSVSARSRLSSYGHPDTANGLIDVADRRMGLQFGGFCAVGAALISPALQRGVRDGHGRPSPVGTAKASPPTIHSIRRKIGAAARAIRLRMHLPALQSHQRSASYGGVTVSTGSLAARETCRGVGTRNRLQNQSCQRQSGTCCLIK